MARSAPSARSFDGIDAAVSSLKADMLAAPGAQPLRGRHIGVVCTDPQRPEVFLLERTASDLGARVALVRPGLELAMARRVGERTGRMLGLLYDALICVDVPETVVQVLRESSGIPAAGDLAGDWVTHKARRPDAPDDERYLLQALMIEACA